MRVPLIYRDAPQFGFDIGTHTVKVVQLKPGSKTSLQGFGYAYFPREAVVEGIIADPEQVAEVVKPLLHKLSYGKLTAKRVVTALPTAKLFTRTLTLPRMSASELDQAVHYEIEQYVPVPLNDLYIDYEVIRMATSQDDQSEILTIAAPRAIVDSYVKLFDLLGLEIGAFESGITAVVRALLHSGDAGASTLVMDIGSLETDLTIYQKYTPLTASVPVGGDSFTDTLTKKLSLKRDQANEIKVKFGIGPSGLHDKVLPAIEPDIQAIIKEVKRVIKYYEERGEGKQKISAIAISGGTASMPGLGEYLQEKIGLPLRVADPWRNINTKKAHLETNHEAPLYTTAVGLALRGIL